MTQAQDRSRKRGAEQPVLERINELAREEHELWKRSDRGISSDDRERLKNLETTLDQCWDLLHQRRALRAAGKDPSESRVRDPQTLEGYAAVDLEGEAPAE